MAPPKIVPKTEDPAPTTPTATTTDPGGSPLAKWPWIATAVLAGVAILIFVITLQNGWSYITKSNEVQEKEDWEQLLGLIGRIDTLVTLILGAVLGVGVGAAKQSGDTKAAAAAAKSNASEATRQNEVAKENQRIAGKNKLAADMGRQDVNTLLAFAAQVDADASKRVSDDSGFAGARVMHLLRQQPPGAVRPLDVLDPIDPALERLGQEAKRLLEEMKEKYE